MGARRPAAVNAEAERMRDEEGCDCPRRDLEIGGRGHEAGCIDSFAERLPKPASNPYETAARSVKVQAMVATIIKDASAAQENIFSREFLEMLIMAPDEWWELVAQKAGTHPPSEETILGVQEFFMRVQQKNQELVR